MGSGADNDSKAAGPTRPTIACIPNSQGICRSVGKRHARPKDPGQCRVADPATNLNRHVSVRNEYRPRCGLGASNQFWLVWQSLDDSQAAYCRSESWRKMEYDSGAAEQGEGGQENRLQY